MVRTGKPATYMQKLKDGKNVVISGSPVFDDKGRVCLVVTFVRDETRLAELNEQTGEQRKLIKEINDKLAFVAQSQGRDLEPVFASSAMQSVVWSSSATPARTPPCSSWARPAWARTCSPA